MATNKYLLLIFVTALCLIAPASLWAQNTEPHSVQRLTWLGDKYATRYEVIIEKEEAGEYIRTLQKFTTDYFIDVSLSPGKYRFQVVPYDFFNIPSPVTEWMDFEVQHVVINPEKPESKDKVRPAALNTEKPESENEVIIPGPEPGTAINNKKSVDIYLGLAWMPILPIYGENELFGEKLSLYGAGLQLAIIWAKQKTLNFGMEGSASWCLSSGDQSVHSLTFNLNAVMRYSVGKAAFNTRMGAGVSLGIDTNPVPVAGHVNFGVSFLLPLLKRLYLEAGIDYVQSFSNSGFLRPSIGLGYRF